MLCPGFIDPHTHYDAQLLWDPLATPSNLHGVTTIIGGNCGFTLAPLAPGDADYTRRMMAKVEGMPLEALEQGVDWTWDSFAEYLDRLDGTLGVNAGFLVGHCALRRRVMGADAVGNEATPEQLDAMIDVLQRVARAPAASGSPRRCRARTPTATASPSPRAGRHATSSSRSRRPCREHEGTTLEYASDGCLDGFTDDDIEFMIDFSRTGDRPLNWNVLTDRQPRARPLPHAARGDGPVRRGRRPGRRPHHADPGRHEHELPHVLRAQHDAGLGRHPGPPARRAHGQAS